MLFLFLLWYLDRAQHTIVGWKVEQPSPQEYKDRSLMERLGYNPDSLDDVVEFYEQMRCGHISP